MKLKKIWMIVFSLNNLANIFLADNLQLFC